MEHIIKASPFYLNVVLGDPYLGSVDKVHEELHGFAVDVLESDGRRSRLGDVVREHGVKIRRAGGQDRAMRRKINAVRDQRHIT